MFEKRDISHGHDDFSCAAQCFALSSFLCSKSLVYDVLRSEQEKQPALYLSSGDEDSLVAADWVEDTRYKLSHLGLAITHKLVTGLDHQMESDQLHSLINWINKQFS